MRSLRWVVVAMLALVAAGCSGSTSQPVVPTPTPLISADCDRGFSYAALVAKDKMADSVSDLDQAVRSCRTVAEWTAASLEHPGAIPLGVDPVVFLTNRCSSADMAATELCKLVERGG